MIGSLSQQEESADDTAMEHLEEISQNSADKKEHFIGPDDPTCEQLCGRRSRREKGGAVVGWGLSFGSGWGRRWSCGGCLTGGRVSACVCKSVGVGRRERKGVVVGPRAQVKRWVYVNVEGLRMYTSRRAMRRA